MGADPTACVICCVQVHAWEPDPRHLPQLQQALQRQARQHSQRREGRFEGRTLGGVIPATQLSAAGRNGGSEWVFACALATTNSGSCAWG